ncbi:MAG: ABC transporter ATP-binding protein [Candidatus Delongbacteria bacterium]|nr:ABC transporter ATP-binding protein [Candidatus Delongbacteria bacterium]MBN2835598.1 ABC transporter ATP-binding protein [Candidatus Delongbacteria bacterium]
MSVFKRTNSILSKRWYYLVGGFISLLIVDFMQLLVPKIVQYVIDDLSSSSLTDDKLFKYLIYLLIITGVIAVFRFFWRFFIIGNALVIEKHLREMIYDKLLILHKKFFNNNKTGDLMAHANNDVSAVRMVYGFGFIAFFDALILTITAIVFMVDIDFKLTVLAFIPLPIISIFIAYFGKVTHKRFKDSQDSFSDLSGVAQESFAGIRVIKGYSLEEYDYNKFKKQSMDLLIKNVSLAKVWGLFHPFMSMIIGLSSAIIIYVGGRGAILNQLTIGEFVALNTYIGLLSWPMMAIGFIINIYQRGKASMERINRILDTEPEIKNEDHCIEIAPEPAHVEFKNVCFTHEGANSKVLNDMSFKAEKGQKIAIIGRTGSGKSTIINLLTRMYDRDSGSITINGHDVRSMKLDNLRDFISLVPQETFLFSESIKENINYSGKTDKIEEIENISKTAGIYDNIMDFKDKFETELGEKGVNLSGGQKQRVSIARALLKDSPIIILDDSLSAVDTHTERLIWSNLKPVLSEKTVIIITHRISSITDCDRIYVIDDGKVAEMGTHEQLIKHNGIYNDIYEKQQIEEKLSENGGEE